MAGHRRTDAAIAAIKERIDQFLLSGMKPAAIREALGSPLNTTPILLSQRTVERYCAELREEWRRKAREGDEAELARAFQIAAAQELFRQAAARAARTGATPAGAGYMNIQLKALERLAKLLGLDAPTRADVTSGGKPIVEDRPHPLDDLPAAEQAQRLREWADEIEAQADD